MRERWNNFAETFQGEIRSHVGGTIHATNVMRFEDVDLEMYYLRIDKQGFKGLAEGIYAVVNKTPEEWKEDQDMSSIVSSIATEQFFGPNLLARDVVDYEHVVIPLLIGSADHSNNSWSILKLQRPTPEILSEVLRAPEKGEEDVCYIVEEDLN